MLARIKSQALRLLPKNAFTRGVSVLVGGTVGAQILMVLAAPLLTRLYSPEDFGLLAVYAGLLGMVAVIASLRYELAIPLPESDQEAAGIVVLSLLIVGGVTLLSAGVVWFAGQPIASALGVPQLADYFWLLPLGVLLQGVYKVFNYWSLRTKEFSTIARTHIRQVLFTLIIQLFGFKVGGVALVAGQAGGHGMGSVSLARLALRNPVFRQWCWQDVWKTAKHYRNFPLFSTWSGFFNVAGGQLPPLMFAALFSAGAAGIYALAHRVLAMPMRLVGEAIGKVFLSSAAEAYRQGRLGPLVGQVHDKLAQIAMPPALVLVVIGPDIFALVFGEPWRAAGEFARWMAPWLYIVFITSPLSTLPSVMGKQRQDLLFQAILLAARATAIVLGAWCDDLQVTVILFSGLSALCWVGYLVWIGKLTNNTVGMLLRPTLRALMVSLVAVAPLWLGLAWPTYSIIWWLSLAACTGLVLLHYWYNFREAY